ncbi:MAG: extracellular solute-binding protein [Alphaproteobacteria bacterium]|jgi:multiple sugar transport system substrate-binding protein|tara:strand:- start:352 stop:1674 length:1323 start_codon:yes stop_codon:yes gene_type:complete
MNILNKIFFIIILFFSSYLFAITASDIENANPEGQTVEFWVQYSDERLDAMMARAERFEKETGIKVNITYKGHYGKVQSAMMTTAGTSDQADVARGYGNAAADMYQIGAAMDQTILAESKKWGVTQSDIDDWGANWTVGFSAYFDGNPKLLHEVGKSLEVVYYNKDWLNELGLSEPQTPAEFAEAACAATNSTFSGRVGDTASLGYEIDTDASNFAAWVFAHGGDVFDYDSGQYILNSSEAVAAMEFIQGMANKGCAQVTRDKYADQQYLGLGSNLFALSSTSGITYFQKAIEEGYNGQWEISKVPHTTKNPVMNLYGGGLIMGNTGNVDKMVAAYQWMKYISNTENSAVWSTESGYGFVRTSSADHPLIQAKRNELPQYDRSLGLIQYGKGEPSVPAYYSVRGEIEKAYAAIINGDDIMSTLNALNDEANAILADAIEN